MRYETIEVSRSDRVATVTLNRPEKKNAMNPQLHRDMTVALEELRYDEEVGVLVITGAGEESFCAGMDLKEFFHELKPSPAEFDRIFRMATEWRGRTLRQYPKPTIAMINGYCFGGAFGIVEGCDLAVAADEATFGLSEINFRNLPGGCVSKALGRIMHPRQALLYGLTGRRFDGRKAAEMGFVNFSVPWERLHAETMALAREIASKDAAALHATKDAFYYSLEMPFDAAVSYAHAKENDLLVRQKGGWLEQGVGDFVKGLYKPGLGANPKALA